MSANLQAREREFRENAQGVSFWGGAGAFTPAAALAQWMGAENPDTALRDKPPQATAERDEEARLFDLIENGSMVELGAGTNLPQWLKDRLAGRGHGGENYAFGEPGVDSDGDGVEDDKENNGYSSRRQSLISYMIDTAIADLDRQIGQIDQQLALTDRQLAEIVQNLDRIARERAELAPQIDAQKQIVADQQVKVDAAQAAVTEQTAKVADQTQVVERKQTEVTTQEGVVETAQVDLNTKQATLDQSIRKSDAVINAARATNGVTDDGAVVQTAAEADSEATALAKYHDEIRARYDAKGVGAEFDLIEQWRKDPDSVSQDDAMAAADKIRAAGLTTDPTTELAKILKEKDASDPFLNTTEAARAENRGNLVTRDLAQDVLAKETKKLDTLKQELADEQTKLDTEKQILAEKQQKLEEEKKQLAADKEKLAALEARDKELAQEQEKLEAQQKTLTEKREALLEERQKLETAKAKLSDPAYQAKLKSMKPEEAAAELDKLGISAETKAQIAAEIKNAAPEPAPAAKGATPSPTAEALIAKASQSSGSISFANEDGKGIPDDNKAQSAFSAAASQTAATESKKPEDELKPPAVTAPAQTAPSAAMA